MMHGQKNIKLSSICFEQVIFHHHEEFCTSSLQHFTVHLMRSIVADRIRMIRIVPIKLYGEIL
jgi:hypothetical protein